jgi:hypothetical protein
MMDGSQEPDGASSEARTLNVLASPDVRAGVYADIASISNDSDGVTIDFLFNEPGEGLNAVLQARIHMSHRMALRLLNTLSENVRKWAPQELELRDRERQQLQDASRATSEEQG